MEKLTRTVDAGGERSDALDPNALKTIFKAYDIRGRVDKNELNGKIMKQIGAAFAAYTKQNKIMVSRDCRLTSEELSRAFIEGVLGQGKDVINLGTTTTDTLYYSAVIEKTPGAMITASHNPVAYNGVKLCKAEAVPLSSEELQVIRNNIPVTSNSNKRGVERHADVSTEYINHLLSTLVNPEKISKLRIAVDSGNGVGGPAVEQIFNRLPAELSGIYLEPDGLFPNHPANPSRHENLKDLINLIVQENADFGVAFDGDADRAVLVDDRGDILSGNILIPLIANWYLPKHPPDSVIIYDSICSRAVPENIEKCGGKAVCSRVGSPFIKQVMSEEGAIFGGELSGHYYFKENFSIDSGLLVMLIMMQIVSENGEPLSALRKEFVQYYMPEEIIFEVNNREAVIDEIAAKFSSHKTANINLFDGLTVEWPDRWFNLRASNTEPLIRLNAEAVDQSSATKLIKEVSDLIKEIK